jgi:hypothetical protein
MTDSVPPELVGLIIAIAGFFGTAAALVIYVYAARQGKRRGKRPAAVIQDDLQALKNGPYRRLGETVQKAASKTTEALSATLTSAGDNLASTETEQSQSGQKLAAPSSNQRILRQGLYDPAFSLPSRSQRVLEKPIRGMPGRMLDPLNLADNIDQMVQERLRGRPDLAGRRIRLASALDGGLRIYVDDETFEAVGDVTDFKVRELIRDAIREGEGF